ncbi:MAG: hypothetical protein TREMPRED_001769 [Tremellales sp. Tagirdzhanova-0007]|nr:MAG: hypothetical protein TREMPRED_001769 [Tremellales sp. Tagirdzhanova-0007]
MPEPKHAIIIPTSAWGHVVPMAHFCQQLLLHHRNLHLTVLLAPSVAVRFEQQVLALDLKTAHPEPERLQRFTVVATDEQPKFRDGVPVATKGPGTLKENIPIYLEKLLVSADMGAAGENKFAGIRPRLIIYDLFLTFVPNTFTTILEHHKLPPIPLFAFFPCPAAATLSIFGSFETRGSRAIFRQQYEKEMAGGIESDVALVKAFGSGTGEVIRMPDMPDMYDYEYEPMYAAFPWPLYVLYNQYDAFDSIRSPSVTGLISTGVGEIEPNAVKAVEKDFGKRCLMVGPQYPEAVWRGETGTRPTDGDAKRVMAFLDAHPPHSVAYLSFGSMFWPYERPEIVDYLVESLISNRVPFIYTQPSELACPSPALLEMFHREPETCFVIFAPQWHVLSHPSLGFFVSHCGNNSVYEAMLQGVPIVAIPFGADQPVLASQLIRAGAAIELEQIKSFKDPSSTRLYSGVDIIGTEEAIKAELAGVWAKMLGEEGDSMRRGMKRSKDVCEKSRREGSSWLAMEAVGEMISVCSV